MSASKKTDSAERSASDERSGDHGPTEASDRTEGEGAPKRAAKVDTTESRSPDKSRAKDSHDSAPTSPRKRRRRSRRRGSEAPNQKGDTPEDRSSIPLDENGRERPYFLTQFPKDPELELLCRAFEAGDYAFVRQHAEKVARETDSDDVRRAALELFERIKPDPLVKYMLLVSLGLLLFLVIHAYTSHAH